ncbi:MAG TPA: hypothetical protein VMN99_15505 [Anaerolineales bacterium]|nr:hypothetical protein [Anaerolineales bacterium]
MTRFVFLFVMILIAGCTPKPTAIVSEADEARTTLVNFLTLLSTKNYTEAVPLYGGDYEALQVFNSEIDPADHLALWTWVCENRLLQCLEVRSAVLRNQEGDTHVFQVEFNNPDGSLFVLGPCCGANETEMPPVSQFAYTVMKNAEGKFVVVNTPPYVP